MPNKNSRASRTLDRVRTKMAPLRELPTREVQDTRVATAVELVEQNTPQVARSIEAFDSDGLLGLVAETVTRPVVKRVSSVLKGVLRRTKPSSERLQQLATAATQNSDLTKAVCGFVTSAVVGNPVGAVIGALKVIKESKSILDGGKQASRDRRRFEQIRSKLDQAIERHRDKLKRLEGLRKYAIEGWSFAAEGNPVPLLMTAAADLSRVITHVKESRSRIEAERIVAERIEAERREAERREAERREAERRYWAERCGAATQDGGSCRRRVVGGGQCHDHS